MKIAGMRAGRGEREKRKRLSRMRIQGGGWERKRKVEVVGSRKVEVVGSRRCDQPVRGRMGGYARRRRGRAG
eukprot:COSAG02_NODE_54529_length_295_cov_1.392857_1_plen_71_part_10